MNIHVHVFVWIYIFSFLGYIPRSRIAGSYGNSIFNFFWGEEEVLWFSFLFFFEFLFYIGV